MALNCVQMDVYLVLIWCSLFVSLLLPGNVVSLGTWGGVVGFVSCIGVFFFPRFCSSMIPSRLFFWIGLCHGNTYLVYGFDWHSSMLYVPGAIPPLTCTIQLNNDHIPEVDPWAAGNTLC